MRFLTSHRRFPALLLLAAAAACSHYMEARRGAERVAVGMVRENYTDAYQAYEAGDLDSAERGFEAFLVANPDGILSDDARYYIGTIHAARGRCDKAVTVFEELLELDPRSNFKPETRIELGRCLSLLGRYEESNRHLLEINPRRLDRQRNFVRARTLGENFLALRRAYDALGWMVEAHRLAQVTSETERTRAEIEHIIDKGLSAGELERAVGIYGDDYPGTNARLRLAEIYLEEGMQGRAEQMLKELSEAEHGKGSREAWRAANLLRHLHKEPDRPTGPLPGRVVIGCVLPLSGKFAVYGDRALRGILLGLNLYGNDPNRLIRLEVRDSHGDAKETVRAIEELATVEGALALIGPLLSRTAEAGAAVAQRKGVPIVTLTQQEGVTAVGNYVFRNGLTNSNQVRAVARHAVLKLGLRRFGILYPADRYGKELASLFEDEVSRLQGEVLVSTAYPQEQIDFGEQIEQLKFEPPIEALFIPDNFETVAVIVPQLAYYEIRDVQLLGANGWNSPRLVEKSGPGVRGAVFSGGFFAASRRRGVRRFVERYLVTYGHDPEILAAHGFDTARLLSDLVNRQSVWSRTDLRASLAAVRKFDGVTGRLDFSDSGDVRKDPFLLTVRGSHITQLN